MLKHLNASPVSPRRVVVMGAGGFVGGAIVERLESERVPVLALSRRDIDLFAPRAADDLAALLRPDDTFIAVSAVAPCKNSGMLVQNMIIACAIVKALTIRPVAHVLNISSDAVYADSTGLLTEVSPAAPDSLHGAMHLAREIMFRTELKAPIAMVRPSLLYGANDPHNGYGPNRFRRLAAEGQDIVLFGEGEELRDHVDVEDVANLAFLIVRFRSTGIANAASGDLVSFRELAEFVASEFHPRVAVAGTPRTGPIPHNGYRAFDNRAVLAAFPGFRFRTWREGLARVHAGITSGTPRPAPPSGMARPRAGSDD